MQPYHTEHDVTLYHGEVLPMLGLLPDQSVQTVVTSPPYYNLRDYDVPPTDWPATEYSPMRGLPPVQVPAVTCCLGNESDPWSYVGHLLLVLRELGRIIRRDGTVWLNIGDSYSSKANGGATFDRHRGSSHRPGVIAPQINTTAHARYKSLLGVPWRLVFALQADGWAVRNEIIWYKPNAMPESVTDRLSNRYERVFLLTRANRYWFDLHPIREAHAAKSIYQRDVARRKPHGQGKGYLAGESKAARPDGLRELSEAGRNPGDMWSIPTAPFHGAHFAVMSPEVARRCVLAGCPEGGVVLDPFVGACTTMMVARQTARRGVGIDLSAGALDIGIPRIGQPVLDLDLPVQAIITPIDDQLALDMD